jgi:predicted nuclease of predicted toxin-antitoxin system
LKFLLDVHIAASIGRMLVERGHDVLRALDAHAFWSDAQLLDLAVLEDRVLVTEDRDFSDLIYRLGAVAPLAIIYVRSSPADQPAMADRIRLVLANTTIDGHMVVVQRASVRLRPFPGNNDNG